MDLGPRADGRARADLPDEPVVLGPLLLGVPLLEHLLDLLYLLYLPPHPPTYSTYLLLPGYYSLKRAIVP